MPASMLLKNFSIIARMLFSCAFLFFALDAQAGDLHGTVTDNTGGAVPNAVIALLPENGAAPAPRTPLPEALMDQRDRQFAPHVIVVQRNTPVRFPNSDDIRHQVYSFSAPKRFNLPLYHGVPAAPVVFDQTGEVVLGCNIHDRMLGYIYVVDTPWFAKTDDKGALIIRGVPAGSYRAQLWYPGLSASAPAIAARVQISADAATRIAFNNAEREAGTEPAPSTTTTTTRSWGERRGNDYP